MTVWKSDGQCQYGELTDARCPKAAKWKRNPANDPLDVGGYWCDEHKWEDDLPMDLGRRVQGGRRCAY